MQEEITQYKLRSTSRSRLTKTLRAGAPGRAPNVQWVCKQRIRLVPGADKVVPALYVLESVEELREKVRLGHLVVLTLDDRVVDLTSFTPAPPPPVPLEPTPPVAKIFHYVGHDAPNQHPNDAVSTPQELEKTLDGLFGAPEPVSVEALPQERETVETVLDVEEVESVVEPPPQPEPVIDPEPVVVPLPEVRSGKKGKR